MNQIKLATEQLIAFVLVDESGSEVVGLGGAFAVEISKNGAAFEPGLGSKAEIDHGWYTYLLTINDTDTAGPLVVKVDADGAVQQNLLYMVKSALSWDAGEGPNILTAQEAAAILRCGESDPTMLMLLPQVDAYLNYATGRTWEDDYPVREEAKSAARMLLVQWHENPGMIGAAGGAHVPLSFGLNAALFQLKILALQLSDEEEEEEVSP
jgi:hypothetical protein